MHRKEMDNMNGMREKTSSPMVYAVADPSSKPWADTPYPLISDTIACLPSDIHATSIPSTHYCREMAYVMAQIHNTILRGVNSIYNQALNIKAGTKDCDDFIFYNKCVYDLLHHHHISEEEIFFPLLRDLTGDSTFCDEETKEHDAFDQGANQWKEYINTTVKNEEYDGKKLREIIEEFGPALHHHLTGEIGWLLSMYKYDSEECKRVFLIMGKEAEANITFNKDLSLVLSCQDNTFLLDGRDAIFPPVPTSILYLVKYIFSRKHARAWKFAPADAFGQRRVLYAA